MKITHKNKIIITTTLLAIILSLASSSTVIKNSIRTSSLANVQASTLPSATFVVNATSIYTGHSVQFTHTGSNGTEPTTLEWNFGDETNGTIGIPTHTYTIAGTYTVTLYMIDDALAEDKVVHSSYIHVYDLPTATFTGNVTSINEGDSVYFLHTGSNGYTPITYAWNFGDGTANETIQNPTHQFVTHGVYTITLYVVDNGGKEAKVVHSNYISVAYYPIGPARTDGFTATSNADLAALATDGSGHSWNHWLIDYGGNTVTSPITIINTTDYVDIINASLASLVNTDGDVVIKNASHVYFDYVDCSCVTGYNITNSSNIWISDCIINAAIDYGIYINDTSIVNIENVSVYDTGMETLFINASFGIGILYSMFNSSECSGNAMTINCTNSVNFMYDNITSDAGASDPEWTGPDGPVYINDTVAVTFYQCDIVNNSIAYLYSTYADIEESNLTGYAAGQLSLEFAMFFAVCTYITITDCVIVNASNGGSDAAVSIYSCNQMDITNVNCTAVLPFSVASFLMDNSYLVNIESCNTWNYDTPVLIDGCWDITIDGSIFTAPLPHSIGPTYMISITDAFTLNESAKINITNNYIDGASGISGIDLSGSSEIYVVNNTFINCIDGLKADDGSYSDGLMLIVNNTINNCTYGIYVFTFDVLIIINCTFINTNDSIDCEIVDTLYIDENNIYNDNGDDAMYILSCTDAQISNNSIFVGIDITYDCIYVDTSNTIQLLGNYLQAAINTTLGINIYHDDTIDVHLNMFDNCSLFVDTCTNDNETGNSYYDYFIITGVTPYGWHNFDALPLDYATGMGFDDLVPIYSARLFGPAAHFNVGGTRSTGHTMHFSFDGSDGSSPMFFTWTFGDGLYSHSVNPSHTYYASGTFIVVLTIVDSNGKASSFSIIISITSSTTPPPAPTPTPTSDQDSMIITILIIAAALAGGIVTLALIAAIRNGASASRGRASSTSRKSHSSSSESRSSGGKRAPASTGSASKRTSASTGKRKSTPARKK